MDYRELLKTYMAVVIDCEGVDFIPKDDDFRIGDLVTIEEVLELRKLSDELCAE